MGWGEVFGVGCAGTPVGGKGRCVFGGGKGESRRAAPRWRASRKGKKKEGGNESAGGFT